MKKLNEMSVTELSQLSYKISKEITEREINERIAKNKNKSLSEILREFYHFGFQVPTGTNIWFIENEGFFGMEVGRYTHSCHVDTTDFIVLLVLGDTKNYVESFSDMWLSKKFTV